MGSPTTSPDSSPTSRYTAAELRTFMEAAFEQAEEAYAQGEVPVGCVFVHKGAVIGRGRNQPNATLNATRHAELEAVDQILALTLVDADGSARPTYTAEVFKSCDLFVTVEPCVMCASALRQL
ncbi:tRNA(adenine34) deaminase, partial [Tieghemiomyces parasiticus]